MKLNLCFLFLLSLQIIFPHYGMAQNTNTGNTADVGPTDGDIKLAATAQATIFAIRIAETYGKMQHIQNSFHQGFYDFFNTYGNPNTPEWRQEQKLGEKNGLVAGQIKGQINGNSIALKVATEDGEKEAIKRFAGKKTGELIDTNYYPPNEVKPISLTTKDIVDPISAESIKNEMNKKIDGYLSPIKNALQIEKYINAFTVDTFSVSNYYGENAFLNSGFFKGDFAFQAWLERPTFCLACNTLFYSTLDILQKRTFENQFSLTYLVSSKTIINILNSAVDKQMENSGKQLGKEWGNKLANTNGYNTGYKAGFVESAQIEYKNNYNKYFQLAFVNIISKYKNSAILSNNKFEVIDNDKLYPSKIFHLKFSTRNDGLKDLKKLALKIDDSLGQLALPNYNITIKSQNNFEQRFENIARLRPDFRVTANTPFTIAIYLKTENQTISTQLNLTYHWDYIVTEFLKLNLSIVELKNHPLYFYIKEQIAQEFMSATGNSQNFYKNKKNTLLQQLVDLINKANLRENVPALISVDNTGKSLCEMAKTDWYQAITFSSNSFYGISKSFKTIYQQLDPSCD